MSILIKGMEMPKEGRLTLQISADGAVYVVNRCNITAETYTTEATPVPPHGRLIDADALEDRCSRQARDEWNKSTGTNWGYAYATFESDVEDAPTIIEAEEDSDD